MATPETEIPAKQIPMSKQQKQFLQSIERDAQNTCQRLCERFLKYFMESDNPDSEETQKFMIILNGQWRMYCKQKRLNVSSNNIVQNYMESVLVDFRSNQGLEKQ